MRLEKASYKAIKYACLNFHYAKRLTLSNLAYSVFNDNNDWCGVICYGQSSNRHVNAGFGLSGNHVIELLRVALNGRHGLTSEAVGISIKLIKRDCPLVKLLISYADANQNHIGIIYQATNWYYVGESQVDKRAGIHIDNKPVSYRGFHDRLGTSGKSKLKKIYGERVEFKPVKQKHKYIYPLDKSLIPMCKALSKPYPKKHADLAQCSAAVLQIAGDGHTDQSAQMT